MVNITLAKNGRRNWTHQLLEEAMEMVERGTTTMRITSIYRVPLQII